MPSFIQDISIFHYNKDYNFPREGQNMNRGEFIFHYNKDYNYTYY